MALFCRMALPPQVHMGFQGTVPLLDLLMQNGGRLLHLLPALATQSELPQVDTGDRVT